MFFFMAGEGDKDREEYSSMYIYNFLFCFLFAALHLSVRYFNGTRYMTVSPLERVPSFRPRSSIEINLGVTC